MGKGKSRKRIRLEFILCWKRSHEELQEVCSRETLNQRCSGRAGVLVLTLLLSGC
jgi:hypothetical protein